MTNSLPKTIAVLATAAIGIGATIFSAERASGNAAGGPLGRMIGIQATPARLTSIADRVLARRDAVPADDIAWAKRAAISDPLSSLPYYIVGASTKSDDARATALVQTAVSHDPRSLPAYTWLLTDGARRRDAVAMTTALIRLNAIAPDLDGYSKALAVLTADPRARKVIKAALTDGPAWRDAYLRNLSATAVDQRITFDMYQTAGLNGAAQVTSPADRQTLLRSMIAAKRFDQAYLAWLQWLPPESRASVRYVFDGAFTGAPALQPFGWTVIDTAGGSVALGARDGLTIDYQATNAASLVEQTLYLPPGKYRLVTRSSVTGETAEDGASLLGWHLSCLPDGGALGDLVIPMNKSALTGSPAFAVTDRCVAQRLTIDVKPSDFAKRIGGSIRSVAVEAVP